MAAAARALPSLPAPPTTAPKVAFLTGKRFWYQTAFCLWSLRHHAGTPLNAIFFDDGSFDSALRDEALRVFPGANVVARDEAAARLDAALWYSAAAYTSGGLHIANRALAPVLVLVALLATHVSARLPLPPTAGRPLTALAAVAALWSLSVNAAPPAGPVPLSPITWWSELTRLTPAPSPSLSRLTPGSLPPGTRILSDNAYFHAAEHAAGFPFPIIPFWAHEVRFLFASDVASAPVAQRLRTLGIGAVHVPRGASPNWPHWSRLPFFRDLVSTWPLVPNPAGLELRRFPVAP